MDFGNGAGKRAASQENSGEERDRLNIVYSAHRKILLWVWIMVLACVVIGSLVPGSSGLMTAIGKLPLSDKTLHFFAYLVLAFLPVLGFDNRRRGIVAGLLMALLGIALEGGQIFSPGRHIELGDILANNLGVICGVFLGRPLRICSASVLLPDHAPVGTAATRRAE